MLLKFFICVFLVFFSSSAYTCGKEKLTNYASRVNVDCETMLRILASIDTHVKLTQDNISKIADSNTPDSDKDNIIQTTLHRHFKSDNSTIQVTTLNRNQPPRNYSIHDYLYNLVEMTRNKKYSKVKLTYYKDYSKLASMDKINNNSFTFNVETFQKFTGCNDNDGHDCYVDITKKIFHATLTKKGDSANHYNVQIDSISATDTYSYEDFNNRADTLLR